MRSHGASASRRVRPASRAVDGGSASRWYLPVSNPLASGKYGSNPNPNRWHAGMMSRSASRSSSE